ncbi:MAG: phage tail protein [Gaiellaceae bacterium]
MDDPGTQFRFVVTIDGKDIGDFTALDGLSAEYNVMQYAEGGENGYEHRLPGQLKYSTIKLSRALDTKSARNGGGLATWFTTLGGMDSRSSATRTAAITAFDAAGQEIASWNLLDAYPFRWTGPSFSADGNSVAKETLELAHHGFIDA